MSEQKICLWCGSLYLEGMEGICRNCWEKNQFSEPEPEPDIPTNCPHDSGWLGRKKEGGIENEEIRP